LIDALPSEATSGRFEVALLRGIAMMLGGDYVAGAAELSTATERAEQSTDARITMSLGNRAIVTGRLADARKLYARATDQARAQSELPTLAWTLATLAGTEVFAGLVASAAANAEEGLALTGDTGQVNVRAYHLAVLACVAAFYGRDDECRTRAAEAFETIRANGLGLQGCLATWALTELELSRSRPMDACVHLDAYWGRGAGPVNRVLNYLLRPDHIEASVRAGRDEAAREALADFEAWTDGTESPHARPLVMRCRALLGTPDEAPALFERALRLHEADDHLFNRARTQLLYGEFLRRARARREARVHLRAAIELFDQFGAAAWAERGRAELRASGETARRRDPSTLDMLTPQELQIARFVTAGSTNKEVAAQLFLSPRTIDFHLRNVFTKLGIRSRHELHRFAFDGEPATSPVRA
jgi:DNA-binding CsgD family transcriptional regulator